MSAIFCRADNSCPFLYQCNTATNICKHDGILPIQAYPTVIYALFPLCSALCNLSGASFGQFKVILLMDALNYTQNQATTLIYSLITGTGLINFFLLIPKRHPTRNTSLVDFNVIVVLIPNVLIGSTLGSLANNFIPAIAADVCIFLIFFGFCFKFYFVLKRIREESVKKQYQRQQLIQMQKSDRGSNLKPLDPKGEQKITPQQKNQAQKMENLSIVDNQKRLSQSNKEQQKSEIEKQQKEVNPFQQQLDQKLKYQQGYHLPQVLATILVFCVFQFLSFTAQGKIKPILDIKLCSEFYFVGVSVLIVVYLAYIVVMYFYTSHNMKKFRRIQYQYNGDLDKVYRYAVVCIAGFLGGFSSGTFGLGSSTIMIFGLLSLELQPQVVSGTVGFQVFFSGAASLAQALALKQISAAEAGFFLGQTFILGGFLTVIARYQLEKFDVQKVNRILVSIIGFFCFANVIASVANMIIGCLEFGITYMVSIKGC